MQHVTNDGNREAGEILLVMADGVGVQQTLGGVRMTAIAGIDDMHMRGHMLCNQMCRTRLGMAHHEHIGMHGREIIDGVEQ